MADNIISAETIHNILFPPHVAPISLGTRIADGVSSLINIGTADRTNIEKKANQTSNLLNIGNDLKVVGSATYEEDINKRTNLSLSLSNAIYEYTDISTNIRQIKNITKIEIVDGSTFILTDSDGGKIYNYLSGVSAPKSATGDTAAMSGAGNAAAALLATLRDNDNIIFTNDGLANNFKRYPNYGQSEGEYKPHYASITVVDAAKNKTSAAAVLVTLGQVDPNNTPLSSIANDRTMAGIRPENRELLILARSSDTYKNQNILYQKNKDIKRSKTKNSDITRLSDVSSLKIGETFNDLALQMDNTKELPDYLFKIGDVILSIPPTHMTVAQMRACDSTQLLNTEARATSNFAHRIVIKINTVFHMYDINNSLKRIMTQFKYNPINIIHSEDLYNLVVAENSWISSAMSSGEFKYVPVTMDEYTLYTIEGHPDSLGCAMQFSLCNFSAYFENKDVDNAIGYYKVVFKDDKIDNNKSFSERTTHLEQGYHPYNMDIVQILKNEDSHYYSEKSNQSNYSIVNFGKLSAITALDSIGGVTIEEEFKTGKLFASLICESISLRYENNFAWFPIIGFSHAVPQYIGPGHTQLSLNAKVHLDDKFAGENGEVNKFTTLSSLMKTYNEKVENQTLFMYYDDRFLVQTPLTLFAKTPICSIQHVGITTIANKPGWSDVNITFHKSTFVTSSNEYDPVAEIDEYWGLRRVISFISNNTNLSTYIENKILKATEEKTEFYGIVADWCKKSSQTIEAMELEDTLVKAINLAASKFKKESIEFSVLKEFFIQTNQLGDRYEPVRKLIRNWKTETAKLKYYGIKSYVSTIRKKNALGFGPILMYRYLQSANKIMMTVEGESYFNLDDEVFPFLDNNTRAKLLFSDEDYGALKVLANDFMVSLTNFCISNSDLFGYGTDQKQQEYMNNFRNILINNAKDEKKFFDYIDQVSGQFQTIIDKGANNLNKSFDKKVVIHITLSENDFSAIMKKNGITQLTYSKQQEIFNSIVKQLEGAFKNSADYIVVELSSIVDSNAKGPITYILQFVQRQDVNKDPNKSLLLLQDKLDTESENKKLEKEVPDIEYYQKPFSAHRYYPRSELLVKFVPQLSGTVGGWFFHKYRASANSAQELVNGLSSSIDEARSWAVDTAAIKAVFSKAPDLDESNRWNPIPIFNTLTYNQAKKGMNPETSEARKRERSFVPGIYYPQDFFDARKDGTVVDENKAFSGMTDFLLASKINFGKYDSTVKKIGENYSKNSTIAFNMTDNEKLPPSSIKNILDYSVNNQQSEVNGMVVKKSDTTVFALTGGYLTDNKKTVSDLMKNVVHNEGAYGVCSLFRSACADPSLADGTNATIVATSTATSTPTNPGNDTSTTPDKTRELISNSISLNWKSLSSKFKGYDIDGGYGAIGPEGIDFICKYIASLDDNDINEMAKTVKDIEDNEMSVDSYIRRIMLFAMELNLSKTGIIAGTTLAGGKYPFALPWDLKADTVTITAKDEGLSGEEGNTSADRSYSFSVKRKQETFQRGIYYSYRSPVQNLPKGYSDLFNLLLLFTAMKKMAYYVKPESSMTSTIDEWFVLPKNFDVGDYEPERYLDSEIINGMMKKISESFNSDDTKQKIVKGGDLIHKTTVTESTKMYFVDQFLGGILPTIGLQNAFPTYKLYVIDSKTSDIKFHTLDAYYDFRLVQDLIVIKSKNDPLHVLKCRVYVDERFITLNGIPNQRDTDRGPYERQDLFTSIDTAGKGGEAFFNMGRIPLRAGMRITLKLGYHTDPRMLDSVFIGTITSIGQTMDFHMFELEAIGDGRELSVPASESREKMTGYNFRQIISKILRGNANVIHFGKVYGTAIERYSREHLFITAVFKFAWNNPAFQKVLSYGITGQGAVVDTGVVGAGLLTATALSPPGLGIALGLGATVTALAGVGLVHQTLMSSDVDYWGMFKGEVYRDWLDWSKGDNWTNVGKYMSGHTFNLSKGTDQIARIFDEAYMWGNDPVDDNIFAVDILNMLFSVGNAYEFNITNKKSIWEVLVDIRRFYPNYCLDIKQYGNRSTIYFGPRDWLMWRTDDPIMAMMPVLSQNSVNVKPDTWYNPAMKDHLQKLYQNNELLHQSDGAQDKAPLVPNQRVHSATSNTNIILNGIKSTPERGWNAVIVNWSDKTPISFVANADIHPNAIRKQVFTIECESELLAISYALSCLKEGVEKMYGGSLVLRGNPKIEPNDRIYIADRINRMFGWIEVETVIHKFDNNLGFTTHIVPLMVCATNSDSYKTTGAMMRQMASNIQISEVLVGFLTGSAIAFVTLAFLPEAAVVMSILSAIGISCLTVDAYNTLSDSATRLQQLFTKINGNGTSNIASGEDEYILEILNGVAHHNHWMSATMLGYQTGVIIKFSWDIINNPLLASQYVTGNIKTGLYKASQAYINSSLPLPGRGVSGAQGATLSLAKKFNKLVDKAIKDSLPEADTVKKVDIKVENWNKTRDELKTSIETLKSKITDIKTNSSVELLRGIEVLEESIKKGDTIISGNKQTWVEKVRQPSSQTIGKANQLGKNVFKGGIFQAVIVGLMKAIEVIPEMFETFMINSITKSNAMSISPLWSKNTLLMAGLDGFQQGNAYFHMKGMLLNVKRILDEVDSMVAFSTPGIDGITINAPVSQESKNKLIATAAKGMAVPTNIKKNVMITQLRTSKIKEYKAAVIATVQEKKSSTFVNNPVYIELIKPEYIFAIMEAESAYLNVRNSKGGNDVGLMQAILTVHKGLYEKEFGRSAIPFTNMGTATKGPAVEANITAVLSDNADLEFKGSDGKGLSGILGMRVGIQVYLTCLEETLRENKDNVDVTSQISVYHQALRRYKSGSGGAFKNVIDKNGNIVESIREGITYAGAIINNRLDDIKKIVNDK